MAEKVKRRVAAARLAVAFVAAGTIAGATAWAEAGPPPTAHSSAVDAFAKVDSSNIENHSLKYVDFAKGQVPSFDEFQKIKATFLKYEKATSAFKYDIKGEINGVNGDLNAVKGQLGNVNGDLSTIKGELGSFVKSGDAIMGDGSVFTAIQAVPGNNPANVLTVPNLISVDALPAGPIQVTNTSGGDLDYSECTAGAGGGTLKPGESVSCATGQHTEVMQLLGGSGGSEVVTLNFTKISGNITVQVLIGL
jgi:hypothetical protein